MLSCLRFREQDYQFELRGAEGLATRPAVKIRCATCRKQRICFEHCVDVEGSLRTGVLMSEGATALTCADFRGVSCATPEDDEEVEKLGGRSFVPLWQPLPDPEPEMDLQESANPEKHSRIFNKLQWEGLDLADPHGQESHFSTFFENQRPRLVGYGEEVWKKMQSYLGRLDEWGKRRISVRKQLASESLKKGHDWTSIGWTHQFVREQLNLQEYDASVILFSFDRKRLWFHAKAAFLPLQDLAPSLDGGTELAQKAQQAKNSADAYAQRPFGKAENFQGFSHVRQGDRGHKTAEGPMMMFGTQTACGFALSSGKDAAGMRSKVGEIRRYKANRRRAIAEEQFAEAHARSLTQLEEILVPKGAVTRTKIMETLDLTGKATLVPNEVGDESNRIEERPGSRHRSFNGTHNITKTHGYAVMVHSDSSADGTLETILFYRPKHSGPGLKKFRDDFLPGHSWMFVAGAVFNMPRERGDGCLIWVASCNPDPLYHGTLPTFTKDAAEKRHRMHDGMGSALLCQREVLMALAAESSEAATEVGVVAKEYQRELKAKTGNNMKPKGVSAIAPHCSSCLTLCCGTCEASDVMRESILARERERKERKVREKQEALDKEEQQKRQVDGVRAVRAPPVPPASSSGKVVAGAARQPHNRSSFDNITSSSSSAVSAAQQLGVQYERARWDDHLPAAAPYQAADVFSEHPHGSASSRPAAAIPVDQGMTEDEQLQLEQALKLSLEETNRASNHPEQRQQPAVDDYDADLQRALEESRKIAEQTEAARRWEMKQQERTAAECAEQEQPRRQDERDTRLRAKPRQILLTSDEDDYDGESDDSWEFADIHDRGDERFEEDENDGPRRWGQEDAFEDFYHGVSGDHNQFLQHGPEPDRAADFGCGPALDTSDRAKSSSSSSSSNRNATAYPVPSFSNGILSHSSSSSSSSSFTAAPNPTGTTRNHHPLSAVAGQHHFVTGRDVPSWQQRQNAYAQTQTGNTSTGFQNQHLSIAAGSSASVDRNARHAVYDRRELHHGHVNESTSRAASSSSSVLRSGVSSASHGQHPHQAPSAQQSASYFNNPVHRSPRPLTPRRRANEENRLYHESELEDEAPNAKRQKGLPSAELNEHDMHPQTEEEYEETLRRVLAESTELQYRGGFT
ncbi:unnamed protein product [Amoebophrya sp. A120]|nr:unnamed protein product [Amoebophrya sp. A120]|eukprot:GSA120T00012664001.1